MKNLEIRNAIAAAGLKHWQLADAIGISPYTLSVWMRHELEGERLERVKQAVAELTKGREG